MEDKYEEIREGLRKQAEDRAKRIERREEELLENVESFDECFEREFLNSVRKIKYSNGKTLEDYICTEVTDICDFPTDFVAKDFVQRDINKILSLIKKVDTSDYKEMLKNKKDIKLSKKYYDIFVYNYNVDTFINLTHMCYSRTPFGKDYLLNTKSVNIPLTKQSVIAKYPNNKITKNTSFKLMESNLEEDMPNVDKVINKKQFENIYYTIEKEIKKDINNTVKTKLMGKNYCIRGVDFIQFNLKHLLVPVYNVRCIKPGFDIKYLVFATDKKAIKD